MGIGKDFDRPLLQTIAYTANNGLESLKADGIELMKFVIEDADLSQDWASIFGDISTLTSKK
jgi:hypothetical protein